MNSDLNTLIETINRRIKDGTLDNLTPVLPFLFRLRGVPYSLKDYFLWEPLFKLTIPINRTIKSARQIGKSETSAVQMLTYSGIMDYLNILYVAPRQEQTRVFSNEKIEPFITHSPLFAGRDPKLPMNTHHRVAREGSHLYFSYALLDAERIRSKTAGALFMDEAQDLDKTFIPVLAETMSASRLGIQQSTGTPKTFDNNLEFQWEQSSQAEWCIPCSNCNKLNVAGVDYDLLKMILPHGLSCARCGNLINTRKGWWEHRHPNRRAHHEGYHAPQPVFPIHCEPFPDEPQDQPSRKWQDLLRAMREYPTYRFYNEKLGESYDNADELISKKALMEFSTLPHRNEIEEAVKASRHPKYHMITMGTDWGGGGESGLSRTGVIILGWKSDRTPDVLYLNRLVNPLPPDEEAAYVWAVYRRFRGNLLADDFCGAGEVKEVVLLQLGFPHKQLMPVAYSPSTTKKVLEYVGVDAHNQKSHIRASKVKSLSIMAALVNKGYYSFPQFESWDKDKYTENLLALVQEKRDKPTSGATYLITRKKGRADDLAHALNYASIAYWYSTGNTPDFTKLINDIPGLTNTAPSAEELGTGEDF